MVVPGGGGGGGGGELTGVLSLLYCMCLNGSIAAV